MNDYIPVQISSRPAGLANQLKEVEYLLADYVRAPYCVAVESAQISLEFALRATGVQEGDRVLCAALGCNAAVQQIRRLGAVPVFVDIDPISFNLDALSLEQVIGKYQHAQQTLPKVLVTMDLFGLPCNYVRIEQICEKYQITLIEDMTQALGALAGGRRCGSFGRFAVGNVLEHENLCENGVIFCHAPSDYLQLLELREVWQHCFGGYGGAHAVCAQAILLRECFKEMEEMLQKRYAVAMRYRSHLQGHVRLQSAEEGARSAHHRVAVALPSATTRARTERLLKSCMQYGIYCPQPLHLPTPASSRAGEELPLVHAPCIAQNLLSLPLHPYINHSAVDRVSRLLLEVLAG